MRFQTSHPVAREALPFVTPTAGLAAISLAAGAFWHSGILLALAFLCVLATFYILWFFRHPRRIPPTEDDALLSPADGTVVAAGSCRHEGFPDGQAQRVAVFMSLFNVHINWAPISGVVERVEYYPGKFLNAMDDKASEENERKIIYLRTQERELIVVKLVAGLVARRIVCPLEKGDAVERGETIGLIRFGSRVEVIVPPSYRLCVQKGDKVTGRMSVLFRTQGRATPNNE